MKHWSLLIAASVLIGLMLSVALARQDGDRPQRRASPEERQLYGQWLKLYADENWTEAIEIGLRLVEVNDQSATHPYNLACAYARSGDEVNASKWIVIAAERGFGFPTTFTTDPDLNSIRHTGGYRTALAMVQATHERTFNERKRQIDATEPLLIDPPGYDPRGKPVPLIISLHGRGGQAAPLAAFWKDAAARIGAVIVAPESLDPLNAGFQWLKVDDGVYHVQYAREYAMKHRNIDPDRIVLAGFSQGGYLAFVTAARHPDLFAGVIPIASYMDENVAPPAADAKQRPRYYIMCGERDPEIDGARKSHQMLMEAGVTSQLKTYPRLGHSLPPDHTREFSRALEFVLQ